MGYEPKRYQPSPVRGAFFLIAALIFVPYLLWSRNWSDILLYTLACSFPLALRLAARESRIYYEKEEYQLRFRDLAFLWIPTLFFVVFWTVPLLLPVATLYGAIAFIVDVAGWVVSRIADRTLSVAIGVVLTGTVGVVSFLIRLKYRSVYGCVEVLVGLLVAGYRLSEEVTPGLNTPIVLALLTAGAFLVVRGLDNVHQGLKNDPIAALLLQAVDKRAGRKTSNND